MQVPLEWKLSVSGANQVKSVMGDLRSAFDRGQISGSEYADSMSKIGREANKVNNISRYQNQVFLAMHPTINKLSRAFSTFASISRDVLSIISAINTLMIASNTRTSNMIELENQMAENRRAFAREKDPLKLQQLVEDYDVLLAKQKEMKNSQITEWWNSLGIAIAGLSIIPAGIINILKNFGFELPKITSLNFGPLTGFLATLSNVFANPAVGTNFALWASQFLDLIPGMKELKKDFGDWLRSLGTIDLRWLDSLTKGLPETIVAIKKSVSDFFLKVIPNLAIAGFNEIIKGFTNFANWIIGKINFLIAGINKIAGKFGVKIQPLQTISTNLIPAINTDNTSPVQGPGQPASAGNTYITVQGSVITERQLMGLVDDKFKEWMKSRGFTGFQ
jgi:hypothetical protein